MNDILLNARSVYVVCGYEPRAGHVVVSNWKSKPKLAGAENFVITVVVTRFH